MESALENYLTYLSALKRSPKVISNTKYSLQLFISFARNLGIGNTKELNASHIQSWFLYQSERTNNEGMPIKASSINNDLVKLKGFLKYLYKQAEINSRLHERIEFLKLPKVLPTSLLNDEEVSVLLQSIDTSNNLGFRDKTITCLLYTTGIRVGELCGLSISDIDFDGGTMLVFGKGSKERILPIGENMLYLLQSYVKAIRPFLMKAYDKEALFYTHRGARITHVTVQRMIKKLSSEVGFQNITPHSLRRSFATELIKADANIYHVKEMMGHEGLDQLKHYVKLNIRDLQKTHRKCHPRG